MFTGIIQSVARVLGSKQLDDLLVLTIARPKSWKLTTGQSISVNGACLTVVDYTDGDFTVELMPETLAKTSFGSGLPKQVNLERAMSADNLFEGHIVQGHVDEVGKVVRHLKSQHSSKLHISFSPGRATEVVDKGSIAVDGVSLTVIEARKDGFSVGLIPHTLDHTTLSELKAGDQVNLEFDIIGKYIRKNLGEQNNGRH